MTVYACRPIRVVTMSVSLLSVLSAVAAPPAAAAVPPNTSDSIFAWGANDVGQLGDGTYLQRHVPTRLDDIPGFAKLAESSGDHSLVVLSDGTLLSWGANSYGQLSDGSLPCFCGRSTPAVVLGLPPVVDAVAGDKHSLALTADGRVWAWGNNFYGQLGDGTNTQRLSPVQVAGIDNVVAISSHSTHVLALRSDGTVWAWGDNGSDQLGTTTSQICPPISTPCSNVPVQVQGISAVAAVDAGGAHSLALKQDGTVWGWGYNGQGQLGNGTTMNTIHPMQVLDASSQPLSQIAQVSGGGNHSTARGTDGRVWAWGWGQYGQLGSGTTASTPLAAPVIGIATATSLSAGVIHNVVVLQDGTLHTWGYNFDGRLGNGMTNNQSTPVRVIGIRAATTAYATASSTFAVGARA